MLVMILVVGLLIPSISFAADQIGVYVAPKFVYGLVQTQGTNLYETEVGEPTFKLKIGSKTDSTFGGSLAIGYDFDKKFNIPVRAEIEYSAFSRADAEKKFTDGNQSMTIKQQFGIQTLFANAYWDINTGTKFTPYLGAGLGMAFISTKYNAKLVDSGNSFSSGFNSSSKNVTNFAWNVGAGLGYDINDSWTVDVGYRFVGLGSVKTNSISPYDDAGIHMKTNNLYQHQFSLGVRYTF